MVVALALALGVMAQDTNTALSPRVRAMLDRFPLPRGGQPSVAIRFSRDTVWVGEQVELVTAAWFPRRLRDRLRRQPTIKAPSLSGLWSARNQMLPIPAEARVIGNQVYDLFVSYQTIFPLGPGRIDAPPAVLTYDVPTSTSYFAPEDRTTLVSPPAHLVARGIPARLTAALGTGPTAHDLRIVWRGPPGGLRVGLPAIVELAIAGSGNLTLWPAPAISWPMNVHVYPEPTDEHVVPAQGVIAGEKRFRFTVVADSAGVFTLPAVSYPYFDPVSAEVRPAVAGALSLPIRPRATGIADRRPPGIAAEDDVPAGARLVRTAWPGLVLLALAPPLLVLWSRRRRPAARTIASAGADPEVALRAALGTPVDAGPDHVVAALRLRGVAREDAEHILRWLSASGRRRYGPSPGAPPEPPPAVGRVISRLRRGVAVLLVIAVLPLKAQTIDDGRSRYEGRDYPGAARSFQSVVDSEPAASGAWLDLGAARWMNGDDVAAAAAWLRGLDLAPRDARIRAAWNAAATIPPDIRGMAPVIPLSSDELLLLALAAWIGLWASVGLRWRTGAWSLGGFLVIVLAVVVGRTEGDRPGQALITNPTVLRISPHPAMPPIAELQAWTPVHIDRRDGDWVLITSDQAPSTGPVASIALAGWVPGSAVVEINPVRSTPGHAAGVVR